MSEKVDSASRRLTSNDDSHGTENPAEAPRALTLEDLRKQRREELKKIPGLYAYRRTLSSAQHRELSRMIFQPSEDR